MNLSPGFATLLAATAVSRVVELEISRRNLAALRTQASAAGVRVQSCESSAAFAAMVAAHALLLAAPAAEQLVAARRVAPAVFWAALAAWLVGQGLRWSSIRALGVAWNTRGAISPAQTVVSDGIYRYLRHPNYLGVLLEAAAIPLAGGAWLSLAVLWPAIAALTWRRLRAEERLLDGLPAWRASFHDRGRLWPRRR